VRSFSICGKAVTLAVSAVRNVAVHFSFTTKMKQYLAEEYIKFEMCYNSFLGDVSEANSQVMQIHKEFNIIVHQYPGDIFCTQHLQALELVEYSLPVRD
jgi:hypothetical protein